MRRGRVTIEAGGESYTFRVPTIKDLMIVFGHLPLLASAEPDPKAEVVTPEQSLRMLEVADAVLARCAKAPKLVLGDPDDIPDGAVALDEIDVQDRLDLWMTLAREAGFTREAAAEIRPTSEAVEGSSSSTVSASDTAEHPAIASEVSTSSSV